MAKGGSRYQPEDGPLMTNGKKVAPPPQTGFRSFLYNKQEGTCLGRTAKSWVQIIVFYIIFYFLLACFWLGCLYIFLSTIDYQLPRFYGTGTIIGVNPGVGYQPWLRNEPESTLIKFNVRDEQSYQRYVKSLDEYLDKYKNITDTRICGPSDSNNDVIVNGKVNDTQSDEACRFTLDAFKRAGCSPENGYGFKSGQPCVILSLNRLIGWKPEDYEAGTIPDEVAGRYKAGNIAFNCDGTYPPDQEYIGERQYIPSEGIDGRFYPYAVMSNYHQPIAMVKFNSLPVNRVVQVECRAYAQNVVQDIESRLGLVQFELLREDFAPKQKEDL